MAASKLSQGYSCEFVSSVPDYLYCKKCTLVARKLNITTCCGESFCHVCITDINKEGKPCPACEEDDYSSFGHMKNQKQIASLQVYCSIKERGCEWSGTLEQLDTHLDPDQDNCQYVDTKCPLHCHMAVPKNKVEQHVAQHCTKRPYVCQHCNFKATYEEVVDKHLAECKYVPLQCPNLCGVTFERDFMEDHMKMCPLEKVKCDFRGVGCTDRFAREDEGEHTRQNSQKHLTLTASLAVETKEQLQQKLLEQNKKHKDDMEKLKDIIKDQGKKLEVRLQTQDQMHKEEEKTLKQQLIECKKMLESQHREGEKVHQRLKEHLENKLYEMKVSFEQSITKLQSQNKVHKQNEQTLKQVIEEQKKDIQELKQMLVAQEQRFYNEIQKLSKEDETMNIKLQQQREEHEARKVDNIKKIDEQEKKLMEHQSLQDKMELAVKNLESRSVQYGDKLDHFSQVLGFKQSFVMKNFTVEKQKDKCGDWNSPPMYTHPFGYKFCIGVDANGRGRGRGRAIYVYLCHLSGEFDHQLKWPVSAEFTIELINQHGGENTTCTRACTLGKTISSYGFHCIEFNIPDSSAGSSHGPLSVLQYQEALLQRMTERRYAFLKHSDIDPYLVNDTLHFNISKINIM